MKSEVASWGATALAILTLVGQYFSQRDSMALEIDRRERTSQQLDNAKERENAYILQWAECLNEKRPPGP